MPPPNLPLSQQMPVPSASTLSPPSLMEFHCSHIMLFCRNGLPENPARIYTNRRRKLYREGIVLLFRFRIANKTVKELRKNQGLTAKELAVALKLDTIDILKVDNLRLRDVPEPLKSKLFPILSGDYTDKIPWL